MANITWRTGLPSATSLVGLGAVNIRDHKVALATGLAEANNFLDADSPVKQGAAVPTVAATEGSLYDSSKGTTHWRWANAPVIVSATSRMFSFDSVANSAMSYLVGTPGYSEWGTTLTAGSTAVEISGSTNVAAEGQYNQSYGTVFASTPTVILATSYSAQASGTVPILARLVDSGVTTGGFKYIVEARGGASAATVNWSAFGTMTGPL